jgi:hypothetical protein
MKSNKTYYLLVIFVVLLLVAWYVTSDRGEKTSTDVKFEKQFFQIDSASVDKIELLWNGKKTTLVKPAAEWRLIEPVDYQANQQFAGMLLSDLKRYKVDSRVSSNIESHNKYGFGDTNEIRVTVFQKGASVGTILVGNLATGPNQTYIKKLDDKDVFLGDGILRNNFARTDQQWRILQMVSIPKETIKSIEFITEKENYIIEKDTLGKFFIGKDSVDNNICTGILNLLNDFNTQGFKDSTLGPDTKFSKIIKIKGFKNYEIDFYKVDTSENSKYYIKISDIKQLFEVDKNFLTVIFKTKKEMLGRKEN